jgi:TetR/AcrR family transcriptional regulator
MTEEQAVGLIDDVPLDEEPTQITRIPKKRNREQSRARILDAAEAAFANRGFDGARLRDIAQVAGVHHALVHHYYEDKVGLFRAVLTRALSQVSTTGIEVIDRGGSYDEIVAGVVGVCFDFFAQHKRLVLVLEAAYRDETSTSYELAHEAVGSFTAPLLVAVKRRVEFGQQRGTVRKDIDAGMLVMLAFGAIAFRFRVGRTMGGLLGLADLEGDLSAERAAAIAFVRSAMSARAT